MNNTKNLLIKIYRTLLNGKNTSSVHEIFSRKKNCMLGHKLCTKRFKKISIIKSIFSDHHRIKLEINNRRKTEQFTNFWKLNKTVVNKCIKDEITKEMSKYLNTNKNKNTTYQYLCINAYINFLKSQINSLFFKLKKLEKIVNPKLRENFF